MADMTLSQLRARMRQALSLEFTTDVSDSEECGALTQTEASQWINEAGKELWGKLATDLHDHIPTLQVTMTYTAAAEEVAVPTALVHQQIRKVERVSLSGSTSTDDRERLTPVSREEMSNLDFSDQGDPQVWSISNATNGTSGPVICLRPKPTAATTLYIQYNQKWTDLTGSSTTANFFPERFQPWIAKWAARRWLEEKMDPRAGVLGDACDKMYEEMKAHFLKEWPATRYQRTRNPDYSRRFGR